MKKKIIRSILGVLGALALGGCGSTSDEMPDCDMLNSGYYAIMETENGYYSNLIGHQCLRYYDKASGTEIYLCGKPECQHQGDENCVATYKGLKTIHTVLYDDMLYILALESEENTVSFQLYKAALDGSSMDKVGEVFSAVNAKNAEYSTCLNGEQSAFIIHRGYAYIPFYLTFGETSSGFAGGGIMKMDIKTGEKEQAYVMERRQSSYPEDLFAVGDYVYFNLNSYNAAAGKWGTYRYNITDGTVASPFPDGDKYTYRMDCMTEERLYTSMVTLGEEDEKRFIGIAAYDSATGEYIQEEFLATKVEWDSPLFGNKFRKLMIYQDNFYLCVADEVLVFSKEGELLASIPYELKEDEQGTNSYAGMREQDGFHIVNNKLYRTRRTSFELYQNKEDAYHVYSCDIDALLAGEGKWEEVYDVKGWWTLSGDMNAVFQKY